MKKTMAEAYNLLKTKIMITNLKGEIVFVNHYLCEYFHKKYEDIQGMSIFNFVLPGDKEYIMKAFKIFLENGKNKIEKIKIIVDGKIHFFEIKSTLDNNQIIHVLRDVTKEEKSKNKVEESYKIIELINSILRHDLLNNFSVIRSALRLMSKEIKNFDPDNKYSEAIEDNVQKGISLINGMKKFSELVKEHQLQEYSLDKILNNIADTHNDILFKIRGNAKVYADETINSTFNNIIGNAIRHGQADEINFDIEQKIKEKKVIVKIFNNGLPIEKDLLPKIFRQGEKGKETGNTGIGLYIVKQNMLRYGGNVKIENLKYGVLCTLEFQSL